MFGYVLLNRAALSPADEARYRAHYCGLCAALRRRHGQFGRLTLTYDMTFLVVLLSSLYEPEAVRRMRRCIAHPKKRHEEVLSEVTEYAADMNILLAYHKCMDDWQDERRVLARSEAALIRRTYQGAAARYARQQAAISEHLAALSELEVRGEEASIDECANHFGALLGELFVYREDQWANALREMGASLGRFIYLMDAYDDLERDLKRGAFNPLRAMARQAEFSAPDALDEHCRRLLTMLMADCTHAFETLPLVMDLEILRNILYSGVWMRFEAIRKKKLTTREKQTGGK